MTLNITAKVIAKSRNQVTGDIITTFELQYPRIIHAELLTHRLFSRNTASSRAVPVNKMLTRILKNPFIPEYFGKNKSGMQASEEVPEYSKEIATRVWRDALTNALETSQDLTDLKVHKQLANRVTEPFQYIQCVVTATAFKNWYRLRNHEAAQPEIQLLAKAMYEADCGAKIDDLIPGEWHLPYIDTEDDRELALPLNDAILVSVARCARVSYFLREGGKSNIEKDLKLAQRLAVESHMSPFEHVACATPVKCMIGNFHSFMQLRKFFYTESNGDISGDYKIYNPREARLMMGEHYDISDIGKKVYG